MFRYTMAVLLYTTDHFFAGRLPSPSTSSSYPPPSTPSL